MKKIKIILLAVLVLVTVVVCFGGCTKRADEPTKEMTLIDYRNGDYKIYKHDKTGVYYFAYDGNGVCVMLNPDGTPYTGGNTDEK